MKALLALFLRRIVFTNMLLFVCLYPKKIQYFALRMINIILL